MPTSFTPSRNVTEGDTQAAGETGSFHHVTGSLRISGTLFLNGVEVTGGGGGGGGGLVTTYSNPANNRVLTSVNGSTINGEANLTFDGTILAVNGIVSSSAVVSASAFYPSGEIEMQPGKSISFNGETATAKITAQGGPGSEILGINSPQTIILQAGNNIVSSSAVISASAFAVNGRNTITDTGTDFSILAASTGMFISADGGPLVLQGALVVTDSGLTIGPKSVDVSEGAALNLNMSGVFNPEKRFDEGGGGGEVVYFGTGSTIAGALYYLKSDGGWSFADASTTGTGHNQLLGLAMSASMPSDGMLIRGFYNALDFYTGSFIKGGPVYVSTTSASMSGAAPTDSSNYVRVVGYGTASGSLVYFNPDATYVEIA